MATDYTYLYEEHPEVISADQLYRICHISKRNAKRNGFWSMDTSPARTVEKRPDGIKSD